MTVSLLSMAQVSYRTSELKRLSSVLSLDESAIASDGSHYLTAANKQIVVRVSDGMVSHIGIRLFDEEMRSLEKSPILDFLERYFLQLSYPPKSVSAANMVRDDQFRFLQGSLASVSAIRFAISDIITGSFPKSWSETGRSFSSMVNSSSVFLLL